MNEWMNEWLCCYSLRGNSEGSIWNFKNFTKCALSANKSHKISIFVNFVAFIWNISRCVAYLTGSRYVLKFIQIFELEVSKSLKFVFCHWILLTTVSYVSCHEIRIEGRVRQLWITYKATLNRSAIFGFCSRIVTH